MEEIWKDIKGYEGIYQISSLGRVKSIDRWVNYTNDNLKHIKERILKIGNNLKGYYHVVLSKNGKHKTMTIHHLVAQAFIPNPDKLPCINHKDEDKSNNIVWVNEDGSIDYDKSNLEWCTYEYNNNYGDRTKKMVTSCTNHPKRSKSVLAIKNCKICLYFPSLGEAERNGFSKIHISECCCGKYKQHKGYRWMWVEDYLADWWGKEMDKYIEKEKAA